MKKLVSIGIVFLLIISFNNSSFNKYIEEGKQAIINEEFIKAKDLFKKAVEKKSDDREARALHKQSEILIEVINLKEEESFQEAADLCQNINNTDSEDGIIKEVAEKIKNECNNYLNDSKEYEDNLNIRINEGKTLMNSGNYSRAKDIFTKIIKEIENTNVYYLQLDEVKTYLNICESK